MNAEKSISSLEEQRTTLKLQLADLDEEIKLAASEVMRHEVRHNEAFESRKTLKRQLSKIEMKLEELSQGSES